MGCGGTDLVAGTGGTATARAELGRIGWVDKGLVAVSGWTAPGRTGTTALWTVARALRSQPVAQAQPVGAVSRAPTEESARRRGEKALGHAGRRA